MVRLRVATRSANIARSATICDRRMVDRTALSFRGCFIRLALAPRQPPGAVFELMRRGQPRLSGAVLNLFTRGHGRIGCQPGAG